VRNYFKEVNAAGYTKIEINNVARWVQSEVNTSSFNWDKWVGSVICPINQAYFTYGVSDLPYYASVIVDVVSLTDKTRINQINLVIDKFGDKLPESAKWIMSLACFYSKREDGENSIAIGRTTVTLDEDGFEINPNYFFAPDHVASLGEDEVEYAKLRTGLTIMPVLVAISLLHCKNIELVNKPITRAMRRRAKRTGKPMVIEKMLELEPFKRKVINETSGGHTGLTLAMHICRGHFREYSEEKPLFGKYSGKYWIPQHARGDKGAGEIIKDYKVKLDD